MSEPKIHRSLYWEALEQRDNQTKLANERETREVAEAERIHAALEYFGKQIAGYDQFDPEYEVVLFDAMKAAVEIANDHRHPVTDDLRRQAFERAAQIADCWRCEITYDAPQNVRERIERQNKVACEIAAAIRAEADTEY